jgi:hypothetical protein
LSNRLSALILTLLAISLYFGEQSVAQAAPSQSSTSTGSLHGQVTDPSGAVVSNATVAVLTNGGPTYSATTSRTGNFEIANLPPGNYTVTANAQGFAVFIQNDVAVGAGQNALFNIALQINVEQQKITVEGVSPTLDVNPSNNAAQVVLSGKDLDALPDDPDELESDLEAMAGPSAGPNGGQLYIDGFTAGQLPPKSSIREIRINQNPFSAEYDKLGYGRIEIFTKPGTDKFHGQVNIVGNDSAFNSRNPFLGTAEQSPYHSVIYMGNIGGPINKKSSFFVDFQRRDIDEIAIVNTPFPLISNPDNILTEDEPNPRTRTNIAPRLDFQLGKNNTLTARYQYYRDTWQNDGVGGTTLPEAGYNTLSTEHTVQLTDTQVIGTKIVNETRFQYLRDNDNQNPVTTPLQTLPSGFTTDASISVIGAFTGGRSSAGTQVDHQDHYELQNYTSIVHGNHFLKFGGRLRAVHEVNYSSAGFNGTYTFANTNDYLEAIEALEAGAQSDTASQFTYNYTTSGVVPTVPVTVVDGGLYIQDDWKVRPNLTISPGLRFETQNDIHDHADWAPRVSFSWAPGAGGKNPSTVIRGGFGLFYDRFTNNLILIADRQNGITQQEFAYSPNCTTPPCPPIDFFPNLPSSPPSGLDSPIYTIQPTLHSPYIIQSAATVERQITKIANVTVSYLGSRGVHQLMSVDVNAPLPGTPGSGPDRPLSPNGKGNNNDIFQYSSYGLFRQNQLIASFNVRAGARLSLFGFYALNYSNSDPIGSASNGTVTSNSFTTAYPTDQYNVHGDYGRAAFANRDRLFMAGTISLPYAFRLSPFMVLASGSPDNVTAGADLAKDLLFNYRPAFAPSPTGTCLSPLAACHYTVPTTTGPYTQIPINYLTGPTNFSLNLRLSKTFGFGPETGGASGQSGGGGGGHTPGAHGGGGPGGGGGGLVRGPGGGIFGGGPATNHRYNLTFSVNARNVFNRVNAAAPVGALTSPDFGKSIALAGGPFSTAASNRRVELSASFSF